MTWTGHWLQKTAAALLAALVVTGAAPARAQTVGGTIVGVVADSQGGALPGVTLTSRNPETGTTRVVVTEGDGRYRFAGLPPGSYDISAELQGFATVGREEPDADDRPRVNHDSTMALAVGAGNGHGQRPGADRRGRPRPRSPRSSRSSRSRRCRSKGRSAITLSLLLPGTSTDTTRAAAAGRQRRRRRHDHRRHQLHRRRPQQHDLARRRRARGPAAVGDPGVQGAHSRRCRPSTAADPAASSACVTQERDQPVQRRGVRVLPPQEPEHA